MSSTFLNRPMDLEAAVKALGERELLRAAQVMAAWDVDAERLKALAVLGQQTLEKRVYVVKDPHEIDRVCAFCGANEWSDGVRFDHKVDCPVLMPSASHSESVQVREMLAVTLAPVVAQLLRGAERGAGGGTEGGAEGEAPLAPVGGGPKGGSPAAVGAAVVAASAAPGEEPDWHDARAWAAWALAPQVAQCFNAPQGLGGGSTLVDLIGRQLAADERFNAPQG